MNEEQIRKELKKRGEEIKATVKVLRKETLRDVSGVRNCCDTGPVCVRGMTGAQKAADMRQDQGK